MNPVPSELLVPWLVTNLASLALLFFSWKRPPAARLLWGAVFIVASVFNAYTVISDPQVYVTGFGDHAWPLVQPVIRGWFARNATQLVLLVALWQLLSGSCMIAGGRLLRYGGAGAMIFLIGIVPLGTGSAFPSTLLMAAGVGLAMRGRRAQ